MNSSPLAVATAPGLGTAGSFAVLATSTVTNTGPSVIEGNLGVSPGSAVTGFPPGIVTNGTIHAADAVAAQARSDATTAYNNLAGQACDVNLTGQDLGGKTLTAGVYCFSSSAQLTGTLILDAQGDPNAVFIFQIGSTLTTASNATVLLINGGDPCKVFWQVGSSATLGTNTTFIGNILALTSITLQTGTKLDPGRALALNGAVTLDTNRVSITTCGPQSSATATVVAATATTAAAATATTAAAATATTAAAATATTIAQLPAATQTAIAQLPAATQTAIALQTATTRSTTVDANNDDKEDERRLTREQRRQRERTNQSNEADYRTEGNVLQVVCTPFTQTTPATPVTPTRAATTVTTATATATAAATPARPALTATPTPVAPIQVPIQMPGGQIPGREDPEPDEGLTAYAVALAAESDTADIPYVVIGTIDGEQKVRLHGDARATCSSIRVGDYLEADGEKQHELLFDADDVTIKRGR